MDFLPWETFTHIVMRSSQALPTVSRTCLNIQFPD
jgi:hypothetical protein